MSKSEDMLYKRNGLVLYKKYREYLIPAIFSGMSIMLGVIINGIMVGQFIGADAMAAVNVAEPIVLFFQALFFLLGMGGATLIAISKGQRKEHKAHDIFTMACLALLALSIIIVLLGSVFLDGLVGIICNEPTLFDLTKDYARVLLFGAPLMLLVPGMVFFIRVDGQPVLSANILVVANISNVLLNFVYVYLLDMGIAGAALATVTGYALGLIPVLRYWFSGKRTLRFVKPSLGKIRLIGEMVGYGIAGSVNTLLLMAKTLFINLIVMSVGGADGMAVFAVCNFSISFVSMFLTGASDTMTPMVGLLFGEKDWKGVRFVLNRALTVVLGCCIASILLLQLFPEQILSLFNVVSEAQVAMGVPGLRIFAFCLLGVGFSYTYMYYLQTIGHRYISLTLTLLRGFVLIIPCAFILTEFMGMSGIWWAYVLSEWLTVAITLLLCKIASIRSKGRYSGIFLAETPPADEALYDATVQNKAEDAVAVSEGLIEFGQRHALSDSQAKLMGLVAEEAIVHIRDFNEAGATEHTKPLNIDVLCRIRTDDIILSLRDDGKPFDALASLLPEQEAAESTGASGNGSSAASGSGNPIASGSGSTGASVNESSATSDKADELSLDSISVITRIAKSVEYTHALGLNNTIVILSKELKQ